MHIRYGSTLTVTLLFTLLLIFPAHAQGQNEDAELARIVLISFDKSALELPKTVARIDFDYARLPRTASGAPSAAALNGRYNASELIQRVRLWSDQPSRDLDQGLPGPLLRRDEMTKAERSNKLQMKKKELRSLWAKYQPRYLLRTIDPPYDTLFTTETGRVVQLNDMSIHYRIELRDSSGRKAFIKAAKRIPGVLDADPPIKATLNASAATPSYQPDDPKYPFQYYLLDNETYGTEAAEVWPLIINADARELDGATERTDIAIHEPANDGNLADLERHPDLEPNISVSQWADYFNPHIIEVAGVASARADNGIGIAGTAHNSRLQLYVWQNNTPSVANYIYDARFNGADVINFSWTTSTNSLQVKQAIEDAYIADIFMVASVGRGGERVEAEGQPGALYPASYDNYVTTVAATDGSDGHLAGSNYGPVVDIAAPGYEIYTTNADSIFGTPQYGRFSGTSFAVPMVAGAAAMIRELTYSTSPDEIQSIIESTAKPLPNDNNGEKFGAGLLKADDAVYESLNQEATVIDIYSGIEDNIISVDIFVREGGELNLQGDNELENSKIFVAGELTGGGTLTLTGDADVVFLQGGEDHFGGTICDDQGCQGGQVLPASITSDMTINGTWHVDNTTVTGGATLTLDPGATLKFRPNKRLIVEDGASIFAEGTAGNKIRFKRNNASEPWDGVEVRGQGQHVFEHVIFPGAGAQKNYRGA